MPAIDAPTLRIELRHTSASRPDPLGSGKPVGAEFKLGDHSIINAWFARLPIDAKGVRTFGVHRYNEPPTACPPALTLYTGHAAIDLKKLEIPLNVEVIAVVGDVDKANPEQVAKVETINDFTAHHQSRREAAKAGGDADR